MKFINQKIKNKHFKLKYLESVVIPTTRNLKGSLLHKYNGGLIMKGKLEKLQEKALKLGWVLTKAEKGEYFIGKYMFSKSIKGEEEDQKEFACNLTDVEFFIKQKEGIYK